jgi:hypothetical protein
MSETLGSETIFELLSHARFEIGGKDHDQLVKLHSKYPEAPADDESIGELAAGWEEFRDKLRISTGTLLKADAVSFLLGAGASKECGGPLIGTIPLELERNLLDDGIVGRERPRIREWLKCFYTAVRRAGGDGVAAPVTREDILQRREAVPDAAEPLQVNLESLLSLLHRWRSALPQKGGRLRLDGAPPVDIRSDVINSCVLRVTSALAKRCRLPDGDAANVGFQAYRDLLRKVLTRPLNLKRANIFTLNYDTLVEQAADSESVVLIDGFVGSVRRTFRPESYDHDLYFPAETTEGRVHRSERVLHLYKLHGSVTWTAEDPSWENPYGIRAHGDEMRVDRFVLIYPTPAKFGETLGMPYAELLRRFAAAIVRPQSVLFVVGYGFGDEHIYAIVRQALAFPSFTLVVVDPNPQSEFVKTLRARNDQRVWILSGSTFGTLTGFVRHALADLHDEGIRRKVMDTYRALREGKPADTYSGGATDA